MSLRNQKNLVAVVGVVVALLAATALLGGYANIMPAKPDTATQAKACPGGAGMSCTGQAMAAFNPEACPAGRTEPCCAEDPPKDCCGESCPPDCPEPCCCEPCPPDCPEPCCCEPCPPDCPEPCCAKQAETGGCCAAGAVTQ